MLWFFFSYECTNILFLFFYKENYKKLSCKSNPIICINYIIKIIGIKFIKLMEYDKYNFGIFTLIKLMSNITKEFHIT